MNQKGFSLTELNACCAILIVLCGVAYPSFGKMRDSAIFRQEIRELYSHLQRAKLEAIKKDTYTVFKFHEKGYMIFVDDGANGGIEGDWVQQQGERTLVKHTYPDKVSMVKTTFTGKRSRFRSISGVKAGRIHLKNDSGSRAEIVLNTVGRIRIAKL